MKTQEQKIKKLQDFKELDFSTPELFLEFHLSKEETLVKAVTQVKREKEGASELFLNGENLEFLSISINGVEISNSSYEVQEKGLLIKLEPESSDFKIEIENKIKPSENTELEGLYLSGDILCTQNEPMGFRKITYSLDRPDNMVKVTTTLVGDAKEFPFMLSNGNLLSDKKLKEGQHMRVWEDPFPKPLYLFALVAGQLSEVKDSYVTKTGREIDLRFYCDPGAEHKCDFAIESLKKAMLWDEERFRLEYDLDLYMVVAVDSFNMGAMENKGLNIFNSALVLADPETATDLNYHRIESVIGHEYFHNWTGNRVTLKNWFQLTLKEGLTVFRDQEFSADLNDSAVERIDMVESLKERQFIEDASPLAHPIRPEEYISMNNFYTATVYEKGAEIIRIFHSLMGEEKFQKAMDLYFKKFDGKAITTEDFVDVMCEVDPRIEKDWVGRWYKTPGTPHVKIKENWNLGTLKLQIEQENPMSKTKNLGYENTYIPIKVQVYDAQGNLVILKVEDKEQSFLDQSILLLKDKTQTFELKEVPSDYQVSYFQDFSAPVTYDVESETRDLAKLAKIDQNSFNRFFAVEQGALSFIDNKNEKHMESLEAIFKDSNISDLMKAKILSPLSFSKIIEGQKTFNPAKVNEMVQLYKEKVGEALGELFYSYLKNSPEQKYQYTLEEKGRRALQTTLYHYLLSTEKFRANAEDLLKRTYDRSDNMTTRFSLYHLAESYKLSVAHRISEDFFDRYKNNQLTLQKWIGAYMSHPEAQEVFRRIKEVQNLEMYSDKIPNFVRALWGGFARNTDVFHDVEANSYRKLMDKIIEVDAINAQMASALMKLFSFTPRLEGDFKEKALKALDVEPSQKEKFSENLSETFSSIKKVLEESCHKK